MEECTMESTRMIRRMEEECICGQTGELMWVTGLMENKMMRESISCLMVNAEKVNGLMV